MRTLLLMRGAPGSGKSTFIKKYGLQNYTLEVDDFRMKIQSPQLSEDFKLLQSQKSDAIAWAKLYESMENRMKNGDFIVLDATAANPKGMRQIQNLSKKYRYQVYYYELDVELDELLRRNQTRPEIDYVPEDQIKRIHQLIKSCKPRSFAKQITDINSILNFVTIDLNEYDEVLLIGDIQGCYTALNSLLKDGIKENTAYIFTGDLLDRGIENKQVIDFMISIFNKKNVFMVEGNHDEYLKNWSNNLLEVDSNGRLKVPSEFKNRTLPQITVTSDDDLINDLTNQLNQAEISKEMFISKTIKSKEISDRIDSYLNEKFEINRFSKALKHHQRLRDQEIEEFKSKVRDLSRKFRQALAFEFGEHKIFVCHAGISYLPQMTLIPTSQLIRGVGSYETEIDEIWEKAYQNNMTQGFTQVHGHRKTQSTEHSICLEDGVEYGGNLCALRLTKSSKELIKIKNAVFKSTEDLQKFDVIEDKKGRTQNDDINRMMSSKFIKTKYLDNNLMSLNFTSSAFKKGRWNRQTISARGLFVDQTTGDVKLRSYNKFFNLHEVKETKLNHLEKSLKFPAYGYRKENGFLGIASSVNGQLQLATKSQISGDYYDMFVEIFDTLTDKEKDTLNRVSMKYSCSFTFEVLHVNDRHMIDFKENHLVLLDAIPNSLTIDGITVDKTFSDNVKRELVFESKHFTQKRLEATFNSLSEILDYYKLHTNDRNSEGLVIEDSNGFMFKIKYDYYSELKKLRYAFHTARSNYHSGIPWGQFSKPIQISFVSWLIKKPLDDFKNKHIIDLFKEYESIFGKSL